jgi:hypothetical protein
MDKRVITIGARLNGEELQLWESLMKRVLQRNQLADKSKVLRDLLFGTLGITTEEDRELLRAHGQDGLLAGEGDKSGYYMSGGNEKPIGSTKQQKAGNDLLKAKRAAQKHQKEIRQKKG